MKRTTGVLTEDELWLALRTAAIPLGRGTPLEPPDDYLPLLSQPVIESSLREKGILGRGTIMSDPWRAALTVLSAPAVRVALFLGSTDRPESGTYYAGPDGVVSHREADGSHCVAFPFDEGEISSVAFEWMSLRDLRGVEPFEADLVPDEVVALSALVDAYREERLRAFIERRSPEPDRFDSGNLEFQLKAGLCRKDPRWLAGILAAHGPQAIAPAPDQLEPGLASLERRGWVQRDADGVTLTGQAQALCDGLGNTTPYVVLATARPADVASVLIGIRGLRSGWVVEYDRDARTVRLRSAGGQALRDVLDEHLKRALRLPVETVAAGRSSRCRSCGRPVPTGQRFCTVCGAEIATSREPARPGANPCPACRSAVPEGANFCLDCGLALAPQPAAQRAAAEPPSVPSGRAVCSNPDCGEPLRAGLKFCTSCGTHVQPAQANR